METVTVTMIMPLVATGAAAGMVPEDAATRITRSSERNWITSALYTLRAKWMERVGEEKKK